MPQLIGVLHNSDIENKSLTALLPQLTEALLRSLKIKSTTERVNSQQSWKQTFLYDHYGNRTFDTNNTTIPDSSQNQNIVNPSISTATNRFNSGQGYLYDSTGNVTQDPQDRTFIYDAENMQTEVKTTSTNATVARYEYDGSGKRVKKIVGSEITIFVYNAAGQLVAEYAINQPSQPTTKTSYLTSDHLGSPRITTDSAGAVKSRHDYMAFGQEIQAGIGGRSTTQKYVDDSIRQQYTGYERDTESGLDYAQARYYSSQHGRFTSVDPLMASASIKNPQTFNRYSYALNSPYKFTDPLGLAATNPQCGNGGRCDTQADDLDQQQTQQQRQQQQQNQQSGQQTNSQNNQQGNAPLQNSPNPAPVNVNPDGGAAAATMTIAVEYMAGGMATVSIGTVAGGVVVVVVTAAVAAAMVYVVLQAQKQPIANSAANSNTNRNSPGTANNATNANTNILFSKQADAIKKYSELLPTLQAHLGFIANGKGPDCLPGSDCHKKNLDHWRGEINGYLKKMKHQVEKYMKGNTQEKYRNATKGFEKELEEVLKSVID
jgi:RHS repeat-associated protein